MSNILFCWILFGVIALWISPSDHIQFFFLLFVIPVSFFSGTYHLFEMCNVCAFPHKQCCAQWKWTNPKMHTGVSNILALHVMHLNWLYWESRPLCRFLYTSLFIAFSCNHLFRRTKQQQRQRHQQKKLRRPDMAFKIARFDKRYQHIPHWPEANTISAEFATKLIYLMWFLLITLSMLICCWLQFEFGDFPNLAVSMASRLVNFSRLSDEFIE